MATVYEIAQKAGVSPATVSRVLTGKKTKAQNRDSVLAAAIALNYPIDSLSAAEVSTQPAGEEPVRSIIMISGRYGDEGAVDAAQQLGYHLIRLPNSEENEAYISHLLSTGEALGILFPDSENNAFAETCSRLYPTVSVRFGWNAHTVWINQEQAYQQLMSELLSRGCKRILCLTVPATLLQVAPELLRNQAESFGLPPDSVRFLDYQQSYYSECYGDHQPLIEQLLAMPKDSRPDGLIVPNSVMGACVVNLLRVYGISVPDDIAVTSAIGSKSDRSCVPYLTSILPPFYELNYEAVRMLDSLIQHHPSPLEVRYSHKIHFGGSTRKELGFFGEISE